MKKKLTQIVCCILFISGLYGEENSATNHEQKATLPGLENRNMIERFLHDGIVNGSLDHSTMIELESDYLEIANNALNHFVKAQAAFHNRQEEAALKHIKESLVFFETADAWALKARIYYQAGERKRSQESWRKASEMSSKYKINKFDPNINRNSFYLFGSQ